MRLKSVLNIFGYLSIVHLISCGDANMTEGPVLKGMLDKAEADKQHDAVVESVRAELDDCSPKDIPSDQRLFYSGGLYLATESLVPQVGTIRGIEKTSLSIRSRILTGAQAASAVGEFLGIPDTRSTVTKESDVNAMRLATGMNSANPSDPTIVIRAKCIAIDKDTNLRSFGHDLYIVADKVTLNGKIDTTAPKTQMGASSKRDGDLHIFATKLELGEAAAIDTGAIKRENILAQIQDQISTSSGPKSWYESNIRKPGQASKIDSAAALSSAKRAELDSNKIFETYFTWKALYGNLSDAGGTGSLIWGSDRSKFQSAVKNGKFWEFILSNPSNMTEAWNQEKAKLTSRVGSGAFENLNPMAGELVSNVNDIVAAEIEESASEEQVRSEVNLKFQGGGKVDIAYIYGTSASAFNHWLSRKNPSTMVLSRGQIESVLGTDRLIMSHKMFVKTSLMVKVVEGRKPSNESVQPSNIYTKNFTEEFSVSNPVTIKQIEMMPPDVEQSIKGYKNALMNNGLGRFSQLSKATIDNIDLLASQP